MNWSFLYGNTVILISKLIMTHQEKVNLEHKEATKYLLLRKKVRKNVKQLKVYIRKILTV